MQKFTLEVKQDMIGLWHITAPSLHHDFHLIGSNLTAVLADVAQAWLMLREQREHGAFAMPREHKLGLL
jgi:hypothetical protein